MPDVWRGGLWGNLWDKGTQLGQVESTFSLALSSLHLSTFFDLGVAFIRFQYITSTFCLHPDFYIIRLHQVAWHQGPGHRASHVRIQIWSALQPHFCSRFVVSFIFEIIFLDHTLLWYFFGKGARLQPHFCSVTHLSNHKLCIFCVWIFDFWYFDTLLKQAKRSISKGARLQPYFCSGFILVVTDISKHNF